MPAPRKIDRPVEKKISLASSDVVQVELMLFSPLEGKVPKGAWAGYVTTLIRADLARRRQEVQHGQ